MAITIPNTFVPDTKIESAPVNANFAEVANAVDKRGDTLTGNLSANAGVTVDGVDLSTIPNTGGTFNPLFAQVVIGSADTNGIRLDLESGTLAVREGDDSAYAPIIASIVNLPSGGSLNFASGDVTITHSTNTLTFGGATSGYLFNNGNLGIGVTPATPDDIYFDALELGKAGCGITANTASLTGSEQTWVLNNAYAAYSGGVVWKYGNTGTAAQLGLEDDNLILRNAVSGSAGGTITWTDRLRVTPGGNIAIGATAKFYLDGVAGTGDTYLYEASPNLVQLFVGGAQRFSVDNTGGALSPYVYATAANLIVDATKKFYLDGGGDSYIEEVSANEIRVMAGGNERLRAVGANGIKITGALTVPTNTPIYLDGSFSGDTYIIEPSGNIMDFYVGGSHRCRIIDAAVASYGATGIGFYAANGGTATGTTVVRNGTDGYLYLTTSSRRFKENISPAVVTDAQLDAFMAAMPSWWDYTGQKNGALGFIAEDLAALPLDRYGFNPLVNYDGDGQIESNRDYALIALHHLVIQRLERKIAALEARTH